MFQPQELTTPQIVSETEAYVTPPAVVTTLLPLITTPDLPDLVDGREMMLAVSY